MKKIKHLFTVFVIILSLCGCTDSGRYEGNFNGCFKIFDCRVQNGILVYTDAGMNEFLNYENMQTIPLCTKPDCTHTKDSDCFGFGKETGEFIHNNKLYWFVQSGRYEDDEFYPILKFMQSDVTGYNEINLVEIEGYIFENAALPCVINDNTLYFTPYKQEDDNREIHLSKIDLDSYRFTDIAIIGEDCGNLKGIFDDKVYFYEMYFDLKNNCFGEEKFQKNGHKFKIYDNYLMYDKDGDIIILNENKDKLIIKNEEMTDFVTIEDDILFCTTPNSSPYYIDLKNEELIRTEFESPSPEDDFFVYDSYKDSYIIYVAKIAFDEETGENTWNINYEKISKSSVIK